MRRLLQGLFVLLGLALPAVAQQAAYVWTPLGYQQISPVTSPSQLLTVPSGTRMALICAETNAVRWRDDGTAPTTAVGMILEPVGTSNNCTVSTGLMYSGNLAAMQFIYVTSPATLDVSYYR